MKFDPSTGLDATDWKLIDLLQQDARMSFAALARALRLSPPAVADRMKRLEDRGVIRAYRAEVDLSALGRTLDVYLTAVVQPKEYPAFRKLVEGLDDIFECHHVTGPGSFILRASVADVSALERLIGKLTRYGPTTTSVLLSTTLDRRHFRPRSVSEP